MSDYLNSRKKQVNIPYYFISSDNKEADTKLSQSQIEYTINLTIFSLVKLLQRHNYFTGERWHPPTLSITKKSGLCFTK